MATELWGSWRWNPAEIDADGHRTWRITAQVKGDHDDGPAAAVQTPGLPLEGDVYAYGNDLDIWAWCRSGPTNIVPRAEKGNLFFFITYTFSTRPPDSTGVGDGGGNSGRDDRGSRKKCADQRIEDPLAEPFSTSGSSIRYTREEEFDKDGKQFRNSAFERILGPLTEFDAHRSQIVVEGNVVNLERGLVESMLNKVNEIAMWDLPARCWKLQDWNWQRKLYGTCGFYYTVRLVFESNAIEIPSNSAAFTSGISPYLVQGPDGRWWLPAWDHYAIDRANKFLKGHWHWLNGTYLFDDINGAPPVATNPNHWVQARDLMGKHIYNVPLSKTTAGKPATSESDWNYVRLQRYLEADFFELGVPTEL